MRSSGQSASPYHKIGLQKRSEYQASIERGENLQGVCIDPTIVYGVTVATLNLETLSRIGIEACVRFAIEAPPWTVPLPGICNPQARSALNPKPILQRPSEAWALLWRALGLLSPGVRSCVRLHSTAFFLSSSRETP